MKTLVAQFAYDLACHVLSGVGEKTGALLEVDYLTPEQFVNESVPDLTAWP